MANQSIYDAFGRFWQHVVALCGGKADRAHNHDDLYYTESQVDTFLTDINTSLSSKADLENGKVPSSQLPSYVDDVIEGAYVSSTEFKDVEENIITPESGKIYVDTDTNKSYRWSGSTYIELTSSALILGETIETAYRGDRGKIAYDFSQNEGQIAYAHSQEKDNPHETTAAQIGAATQGDMTKALSAISTTDGELVVNGNGILGNNSNFTTLNFSTETYNGSYGSFVTPAEGTSYIVGTGKIAIDPNKTYNISFDAKSINGLATAYLNFQYYDANNTYLQSTGYKAISNTVIAAEWKTYTASIAGGELPSNTAYINFRFLLNWNKAADQIYLTNVSLKQVPNTEADVTRALTALSTSDGELVLNGNGIMGTNVNFTKLTYSNETYNGSYGSFVTPESNKLTEAVSAKIPVDPTKKYSVSIDAKTLNGVAVCYLALVCYNSAGTILGTTSYKALFATTVPATWTSYSAEVLPADFKEGTTHVAVRMNLNYHKYDDLVWITNISLKEVVEFNETDPTVPAWAKEATKPTYTSEEVGALPVNLPSCPTTSVKEVTTPGRYYCWGCTDLPQGVGTYGYLEVFVHPTTTNHRYLRYTSATEEGTWELSTFDGSTWTEWKRLATTADLHNSTLLSENTDLNNIKDEGEYCWPWYQETIANTPVHSAFHLTVKKVVDGGVVQEYYQYTGGKTVVWHRQCSSGSWYAWSKVANEEDVLKKTGDMMAGTLSFASSSEPNGWTSIFKNHNATYDDGSYISDYNKNSKNVTLKVSANQNKVSFYDTNSVEHPIYHAGYKPTAEDVGALKRGSYERIQGTSEEHKNLNDYTLPGFYNVKTAYVDNCPAGIGIDAVLLVYPWNENIYNMQEITETAASPMCRRWTRHSNAGTWTAWKAVITEDSKSLITPADIGAISKAGDTVTGKIYSSANNGAFGSSSDNSAIRIDGGTSYDKGAFLTLYGKDNAGTSGGFQLVASNNDSTRKELRGYPDGTLTWSGNNIYHTGNKPNAADVGAFGQSNVTNWTGTDLNDFKSFGAIISTTEKANKPANASPYATVWNIAGYGSSYMIQYYYDVVSQVVYHRGYVDGSWKAWKAMSTTDHTHVWSNSTFGNEQLIISCGNASTLI